MNAYDDNVYDKPDIIPDEPRCAICGRWGATNKHHILPKGIGGRNPEIEKRIPLILVCGMGNNSGCHGKFHSERLHMRWHDGWEFKETEKPTKRIDALMDGDGWRPLRKWSDG